MISSQSTYVRFVCIIFLTIRAASSGPTDTSGKFRNGITTEQTNWISIVSSIEARLKNLDNLYTSQLTPTLEMRLENFQNRINGMEIKLLRVEALLNTKLDRMSDNISSRHFRDDMVQTDLFRKIEAAYDGVTHRLTYMDRKIENSFTKTQGLMEGVMGKIEKLEDELTTKYESMDTQMSEFGSDLNGVKTRFERSEKKILRYLQTHNNITTHRQEELQDSWRADLTIQDNVTKSLEILAEKIDSQMAINYNTSKYIEEFSEQLGRTFNDYASKVSDMGEQIMKSDSSIGNQFNTIETLTNTTRIEIQNSARTLMLQLGKMSNKENTGYEVTDQPSLSEINEKLDVNFDKILTSQNSFTESCHRLQMDESQLENQISDILNKLIDNISKTAKEQYHFLKKIDGSLVKHDVHTKKELYQIGFNVKTMLEQTKKDVEEIDKRMKANTESLKGLSHPKIKNETKELEAIGKNIESLEKIFNETLKEIYNLYSRNMIQQNTSIVKEFKEIFTNLTDTSINAQDKLEKIFRTVQKIEDELHKSNNNTNNPENNEKKGRKNSTGNTTNIDQLIREVFMINITDTNPPERTEDPNCLDFDIDVRFQNQQNSSRCGKAKMGNEKDILPKQKSSDAIDHLDFPIDIRMGENADDHESIDLNNGTTVLESESTNTTEKHLSLQEWLHRSK